MAYDAKRNQIVLLSSPRTIPNPSPVYLYDAPLKTPAAVKVFGGPTATTQQMVILKHTAAEELRPLLEELLGGELRIVAAQRNNALVMSGPRVLVEEAKDIVAQLDLAMDDSPARVRSRASQRTLNEFINAELKEEEEKAKEQNAKKRDP